ncbi:PepSY-associated TM helix domain-containing protein [Xylophilus sp.]|uniref:PepSY-associated TM helix domain-containing protein n=1 Tax=Xylophilus sp. TaxID=2653893 RepID=UPI002D7E3F9C|nr:PepSY-associated TM helix domain-containing protein [Xylophilus sp.]
MKAAALRRWGWVHRWSSLACTLFLLLLCITGLPLVFHDEIDDWLGYGVRSHDATAAPLPTDAIVANVLAGHPGLHVQFVLWDDDTPGVVGLALGRAADSPPGENLAVHVDAATGAVLGEGALDRGPMGFLLKLHGELFLGPAGPLAIGLIALLFVAALVSGVVVYLPFARRIRFGELRRSSPRIRRLDTHNLVGMATLGWAAVVGATGLVNSWGDLAVQVWQARELTQIAATAAPADTGRPVTLDAVLATARAAAPQMQPYFIALPGSVLTSRAHYGVFLRGGTPLSRHLLQPVLVDAATGALAGTRRLPWYMQALFLAQPLHFGNYGGWPLKLLWAALDLATIVVLWTGLRLWLGRRRGTAAAAPPAPDAPARSAPPRRHFAEPVALGLLAIAGLVACLVGDGFLQAAGIVAVALPLAAIARHALRARRRAIPSRTLPTP